MLLSEVVSLKFLVRLLTPSPHVTEQSDQGFQLLTAHLELKASESSSELNFELNFSQLYTYQMTLFSVDLTALN